MHFHSTTHYVYDDANNMDTFSKIVVKLVTVSGLLNVSCKSNQINDPLNLGSVVLDNSFFFLLFLDVL